MALPLIPYVRQSRSKEQTISLDDQLRDIKAWAEREDVLLAEPVIEQGVSGSKSWRERELGAAIEAVKEGRAAGIIVAYQSRLSRESGLSTYEVWTELQAAGARLVCASEGLDTAKGDEELNFGFRALMAREQWKRHKAAWSKTDRYCVENGIYQGPTPVGFSKGRTTALKGTDPKAADKQLTKSDHAPAIERAFRIRANGGSWSEIAAWLTESGVPTSTGQSRWGLSSVASMMRNRIYKGELRNGHVHQFSEYVIIEPSVWAKAQRKAPVAGGRQDAGKWAVLGGLVFCGGCGHRLTPHYSLNRGKTAYRYYVCNNIGKCDERARITPGELEPLVAEAAYDYFAEFISQSGIGRNADTEKLGRLEIEREQAHARFAAWEATSDPLDPGYAEKKAVLREGIQAAEAAIIDERAATRRFPAVDEVRAIIDTGTVEEKRQVIRQALHGATVWKKGVEPHDVAGHELRGDPISDRVEVAWKTLAF